MKVVFVNKPRVAVVYHFFPHYRRAVIHELMNSAVYDYVFVGDAHDPYDSGIRPFEFGDRSKFLETSSRLILKKYLLQNKVVSLIFRKDINTIIYLSDPRFLTTWFSAALARLSGKRILFWSHGWTHPDGLVKDWARRALYSLANGLLLYGHRARKIGIHKGFRPQNLYVIYNSLDYETQKILREKITQEQIEQARANLFNNPSLPLVICTSRLIRSKRIDQLLESAIRLREQQCNVNILLVGDGPERTALQKQAAEYNLPVNFYGECYDETTLSLLFSAANITVAPGNVGLTAIHSLVFGTPVITHNDLDKQMPEVEAIVPGVNGDLFQWGDIDDLARVIRKWVVPKTDNLRKNCYLPIDLLYNPQMQRSRIEQAISGEPYRQNLLEPDLSQVNV